MIQILNINDIIPNPDQPRKTFDEEPIRDLAKSILADGLQEPILVRPISGQSKYQIVQGERRYRAHIEAGLTSIQAKIRELSDDEAFHLAVIENIQRQQMTPFEEASAFSRYVDLGLTHEQIATKVSKSREYISDRLRLLKLIPVFIDWIAQGRISAGHSKQILKLENCVRFFGSNHVWKGSSRSVFDELQYKLHSDFWMADKITVEDVKEWVDGFKHHLICMPIMMINGMRDSIVGDVRGVPITVEMYCDIYDLHISNVLPEDVDFSNKFEIEHSEFDENYRPWEVDRHWDDTRQLLFGRSDILAEWIPPRDTKTLNEEHRAREKIILSGKSITEILDEVNQDMDVLIKISREAGFNSVWNMLDEWIPVKLDPEFSGVNE